MSPVTGRPRSERHPLDDLALYALDALEGDEAAEIEAHLEECAMCRLELAIHEEALGALVEDGPPPEVWDAVQSQIRAGEVVPINGTPLHPVGPTPPHPDLSARRRGMRRRLALLAAAAAVVAVVGVGVGTQLANDGDGSGTLAGVSVDGPTVAVLADAHGADVAQLRATDDGDVLVLEKLPVLAAQREYQLWSVEGTGAVSLGVLGDGHDEVVPLSVPASTTKLAISDEPEGGSIAPTGPVVASGAIVRPACPGLRSPDHPPTAAAPDTAHMERTDTSRAVPRHLGPPGARAATEGGAAAAAPGLPAAALAGLVSAGVALGAGELIAGLDDGLASPVEAVAGEVINRVPRSVERFAIETFGSSDKLALVVGILAFSAVFGIVLGVLSRRRPRVGTLGLAAFAAVGVLASAAGPQASLTAGLPSIVAGLVGVLCLRSLLARAPNRERSSPTAPSDRLSSPAASMASAEVMPVRGGMASRRAFLGMTAAVVAAGALAAAGGRALRSRFSAAESRANVVLPSAARPGPPLPPAATGVEVGVPGVAPFVTLNADFYRVDTALVVPQVRAEDWVLSVTGMVDEPFELTFDELLDRDLIEADITMTCISNPVGGDLVGHARWLGVLTGELLDEARPRSGADQLVGRSVDGYTCGFPLSAAYDRDSLVAVGMNGEPLPLKHGFPARLVTPGLYGYIGSTKWLTELEVTTFDAFDQYWVRRGYADRAPIKTMARIDTPRSLERVAAGPVAVGGVAWAQTRGIDAVEVRIDDGPFRPAQLAQALNRDSWRQWRFDWDAVPGRHTLTVRAVDGRGETQTETRADIVPDGASGWMSLVVTVE